VSRIPFVVIAIVCSEGASFPTLVTISSISFLTCLVEKETNEERGGVIALLFKTLFSIVVTNQRFASSETDFGNSLFNEELRDADDLRRGENLATFGEVDAFLRHAVLTAQVASLRQ